MPGTRFCLIPLPALESLLDAFRVREGVNFFFQAGKAKFAPIASKQEDRREKDMSGPIIMGLILFALGIFVCYQGIDLTVGIPSQPGPGFVPFGLGSVLVVLAAIFLYQFSHSRKERKPSSLPGNYRRTILAVGALCFYALIVGRAGYIFTTFLLFVIWLAWIERKSWAQTFSLACLAVVAVYFFNTLFSVQLPAGLLKGIIR